MPLKPIPTASSSPSLRIHGHHVSIRSQKPGGLHYVHDAAKSDYILVHFKEHPSPEQVSSLELKHHIHLLKLVAKNTYICHYKPVDLLTIRALPFVEFANVYHSDLVQVKHPGKVSHEPTAAIPPGTPATRIGCFIHFHQPHTEEQALSVIRQVAKLGKHGVKHQGRNAFFARVDSQDLSEIAAIDAVARIELAGEHVLHNHRAQVIIRRVETRHTQSFAALNIDLTQLDGNGETVIVADTGFDQGVDDNEHAALIGRIIARKSYTDSESTADSDGHGTHVAASVAGLADSQQFNQPIPGSAPAANIVVKKVTKEGGGAVFGSLSGLLDRQGLTDIFDEGLSAPPVAGQSLPRVQNMSFGTKWADAPLLYDTTAEIIDGLLHQNQDWVFVKSAGNDGRISPSWTHEIQTYAGAKNVITVGACENGHELLRPILARTSYKYDAAALAGNPANIAAFSSRGPTPEGRIKPDVVAPGTVVYSAKTSVPNLPSAKVPGSEPVQYDYTRRGDNTGDPTWWFMQGTSMATPLVSGLCAVIRQAYRAQFNMYPSAAMVKALLVNGAVCPGVNIAATGVTKDLRTNEFGFGLVNLVGSLHPIGANTLYDSNQFAVDNRLAEVNSTVLAAQNEAIRAQRALHRPQQFEKGFMQLFTAQVAIDEALKGASLTATLVWPDPPNEELINKLALVVSKTKTPPANWAEFEPYNADTIINNVQKITWRNLDVGDHWVGVHCAQLSAVNNPSTDANAMSYKQQHFAVCWEVVMPLPT